MHRTTEDVLIRTGLALCREAKDFDQLLRTARSFRYWALRLDLSDPGPVDEELAPITEPDVVALRCAIRQGRRVLWGPLGDWRLKGATLLDQIVGVPELAGMAAQGSDLLAAAARAVVRPLRLTDLWSARQNESPVRCQRLDGHERAVTVCLMLREHPWLVTGDSGEILLWDMSLGILRAIFSGGDGSEIVDACAPPSGAWLATVQIRGGWLGQTVGNHSTLRVWDVRDGRSRVMNQDRDGAYGCEISPDGRWLVSRHRDHRAFFWDTRDWKLAGVITGQADAAIADAGAAMYYAPDGSWFAMANADGSIGLWDPATRTRLHLLTGHRAQAVSLAAPWDSSWLASLGGAELRVWDTRRGVVIRTIRASPAGCAGLIADPRGRWVAASFGTDSVRVLPVRAGGQQHGYVRRAADRMTRRRPTAPGDGSWEFTGARCGSNRDGSRIVSVSAVEATSFGGNMISSRHVISCWDAVTGTRLAGPASRPGNLPQLAVHPDARWAATVSEDRVEFFDPELAAVTAEFGYGRDRIRSMTADSRWLATGFESGSVRLFRPGAGARAAEAPGAAPPAGLDGCFAPPHGRWILVWSGRDAVVLDPRSGAIRSWLEGRNTGVFLNKVINACCFAPDGSWVATADDDGTVRVWDPETAQQQARVPGDEGEDFVQGRCAAAGWMVTVRRDGRLRVRDRLAFILGELSGHGMGQPSRACAVGRSVLAAEDGTAVHVWDVRNGWHLYDLPGERGAAAVPPNREHPDGLLATIGPAGDVRLRDPATGQPSRTAGGDLADSQRDASRIRAVHPAGSWLALSNDRGGLTVCLLPAGEMRQLSSGSGDQLTACTVTPDGSMLVTARHSGVIAVWDTVTWQQLATADTQAALTDACWSPGSDRIYAVGGSGAACFNAPAPRPGPRQ